MESKWHPQNLTRTLPAETPSLASQRLVVQTHSSVPSLFPSTRLEMMACCHSPLPLAETFWSRLECSKYEALLGRSESWNSTETPTARAVRHRHSNSAFRRSAEVIELHPNSASTKCPATQSARVQWKGDCRTTSISCNSISKLKQKSSRREFHNTTLYPDQNYHELYIGRINALLKQNLELSALHLATLISGEHIWECIQSKAHEAVKKADALRMLRDPCPHRQHGAGPAVCHGSQGRRANDAEWKSSHASPNCMTSRRSELPDLCNGKKLHLPLESPSSNRNLLITRARIPWFCRWLRGGRRDPASALSSFATLAMPKSSRPRREFATPNAEKNQQHFPERNTRSYPPSLSPDFTWTTYAYGA